MVLRHWLYSSSVPSSEPPTRKSPCQQVTVGLDGMVNRYAAGDVLSFQRQKLPVKILASQGRRAARDADMAVMLIIGIS